MFGFKAIAEVQNMNAMQTLSAKQRDIVPIAALIAIQEQRDGKAVERMEKVSDKQYHR